MWKRERKKCKTKTPSSRCLSIETDKRQNDLLEEAIKDPLKKYEKKKT